MKLANQKRIRNGSGKDNSNTLKHRNKRIRENCYALIKKRYIKGEKHIVEMDFAEYFKKSDFSGNSKVYYVQFI